MSVLRRVVALFALVLCSASALAVQQTITFNSTSFPGFPSTFSDTGFTFTVTSTQQATGDQPYFQTWTGDGGSTGIKFGSIAFPVTDTVTIKRSDNANFVAVSLWVSNLTNANSMTVEGRLGASVVKTFTVAHNASQTLNFASATIDTIRIVLAGDNVSGLSGVFDTFTFDVPNAAPTVGNFAGDSAQYTQGGSAVKLDQGTAASVTDADSADFNGGNLTASIIANKWAAQDQLGVGNLGSITVSGSTVSDSGTAFGTITSNGQAGADLVVGLNANANVARVQNLLRALTYNNSNNTNPDLGPRTVRVTINDGDGGAPGNNDMTVRVAPSALGGSIQTVSFAGLSLPGTTSSFTADGFNFSLSGGTQRYFQTSSQTPVPPGVIFADTGVATLTLTIQRTDASDFSPNSIILGNFDDNVALGITTKNNGATVQTFSLATGATQRIAMNGNAIDQIVVTGQTGPTFLQVGLIDELVINVSNTAPVIGGVQGDTATFTQAGSAVTLDSNGNATVTDSDSPDFNGGAVAASIIVNKWSAQDVLQVGNVGTITVSGTTVSDSGTAFGTITSNGQGGNDLVVSLNASATPARVQNLLRALQYNNTNVSTPDLAPRTARVTVSDGDGAPPLNNDVTVRVMPTPVPPGTQTVVDFNGLSIVNVSTFDHQGYHFVLTGGTGRYCQVYSATDPLGPGVRALDTSISSLTWTITRIDNADFTLNSLIAGNFDDNTTLVLDARNNGGSVQTRTLATGATQRVTFTNPVVDEIRITGQTDPTFAAMAFIDEITVVPPASPPDIVTTAGSAAYTENAAAVPVDPSATLTDPNNLWGSGTLAAHVTTNVDASDRLSLGSANVTVASNTVTVDGVNVGTVPNNGVVTAGSIMTVTLNASATNTSVQKIVRAFRYDSTSENPPTATRTVVFDVSDGALTDTAFRTVTVASVNDAPVLTAPTPQSVVEDVDSVLSGLIVADADVGGGDLTLTLTASAGTIKATGAVGITVGGSGTGTLTLLGTPTAINTFLGTSGLTYRTAPDANGSATIQAQLSDNGDSGSGGTQLDNKVVTLNITAQPDADLSVTLTNAKAFFTGGTTVHYLLTASNNGGDPIAGSILSFSTSANLGNLVWACSAVAPATCAAPSGVGPLNASVTLPAGGSLLFQFDADVAANPEVDAVATTTLTPPAALQDPTPGDHGAVLTTPVGIFRDGFQ